MLVKSSPTRNFTWLVIITTIVSLAITGCGGNGTNRGGGTPTPLSVTITGCDSSLLGQGVYCATFDLTGPPGTYDVIATFSVGGGAALFASPIGPALAQLLMTSNTNISGVAIVTDGEVIHGRFCWYAGSDLGFVAAQNVLFTLGASVAGTVTFVGQTDACAPFSYNGGGGNSPSSGTGAATGGQSGRANHTDFSFGTKNAVITGGRTNSVSGLVAFNTVDRFHVDPSTLTHTRSTAGNMQVARDDHASAFFFDVNGNIKLLACGGTPTPLAGAATSSADIYCFTPELVTPTAGPMTTARRGHTATWVPSNKIIIIGGNNGGGSPTGLTSIESFDPTTDTFSSLMTALATPRTGHTATLLASGKILIAGGYDPASPTTPLNAELYDPTAGTIMTLASSAVDRIQHTATRLANGWVLIAGGQAVSNPSNIASAALVFMPELGAMGAFTTTQPVMNSARAYHAASRLGDGHVLISGGFSTSGGSATNTAELFLPETLSFTPVANMTVGRADHSSTAISCGAVVIIGGRTDATSYLDTLELYAFNNVVPVVATAATATSSTSGTMFINTTVTDANSDGGYVIIRFRVASGPWRLATIDQQFPSTLANNFPNMEVSGTPSAPVPYSFRWNFQADGLSANQPVTVQILPVGAVLGSALSFNAVTH